MLEPLGKNTKLAEKAINAAWLRNEAIAQNLANVDTPGYKRKVVRFEEYLNSAMTEEDLDKLQINIQEDNTTSMKLDGNNVDIDKETAEMAKNTIRYNTLIEALNLSYRRLRTVINEGRK